MIFETERLYLRPWSEQDADDLYEYAKDPRVGPAAGWQVHTSVENSLEIIRNVLSAPETYAVVRKEDEVSIGSIGLMMKEDSDLDLRENEAELGFWIGRPFWGQGLIPEAANRILRYGFEDLSLKKIWCGYYDGNEKSKRAQEKCGFIYDHTKSGVLCRQLNEIRTLHINCMSEEQWKELQKTG